MTDLPPFGWYPDPVDGSRQRYWNGLEWTEHTADGAATGLARPHGAAAHTPTARTGPSGLGPVREAPPPRSGTRGDGDVDTWMWQSWAVTLLCFGTILSMIGIAHAGRAAGALEAGDVELARQHARRARAWTFSGLVLGVTLVAVTVVVLVLRQGADDLAERCLDPDPGDVTLVARCLEFCADAPAAEPACETFR